MTKYQIYNFVTLEKIGVSYKCRKRARRRCNVLGLEYGKHIYELMAVTV